MLEIRNLSKTFYAGTVNEKTAIDRLNLQVKDGEFITVIGSNGAGKSTLFHLIAGSLLPNSGNIYLDGQEITFLPEHKRARQIGRIFQDPMRGTAPCMTVEENMALSYLRAKKRNFRFGISKEDRAFFQEQLAMLHLGLEDRMKSPIGLLSGGQRQAISLLMCTMVTPKLLLLDEHTAALDPSTAQKVLTITQETVQKNHITTMMITHDIEAALRLGTRTIMMGGGKIIMDISGKEREEMTVPKLLEQFRERSQDSVFSDRMLLSEK